MSGRRTIGNTFTVNTIDDPVSVQAQYTATINAQGEATSPIHSVWQDGDVYMRTKATDEQSWSEWHKIVGESGGETDYTFAISAYKVNYRNVATNPPQDLYPYNAAQWSDMPVLTTAQKPFMWGRVQKKDGDGNNVGSASYIRFTGEDGESPFFADLDNEMDSIVCDETGKPKTAQTVSTVVSLFKGTTRLQNTSVVVHDDTPTGTAYTSGTARDGITVTVTSNQDNSVGVSVAFATGTAQSEKKVFCLVVSTTYNGESVVRNLYFTVNCVRGNVIYKLVPEINEIVKKNNSYVPAGTTRIVCNVVKYVDGVMSTPAASEYLLTYSLDGGTTETTYTSSNAPTPSQVTSNIIFILRVPQTNGTIVDRETIPLVTDGVDGKDGEGVKPNILLRTIFDNGIDPVKEAWDTYWNYVSINSSQLVDGRKSIKINESSYYDFLDLKQNVYGRVKANTWYTLSFNYFAGQQFMTYIYPNNNNYACIDTTEWYVDGERQAPAPSNGQVTWSADNSGGRHSVTFKTSSSFPTQYVMIIFRAPAYGTVSICMPKLEEGKVATSYVAHEDDLKGEKGDKGDTGAKGDKGDAGETGATGQRGKVGRFFYYAGVWEDFASSRSWNVTDAEAPYFKYNTDGQYWVYDPENNGTYTKSQMGNPASGENSPWKLMYNDFKYIISEAIFSNYAHFGSGIINGDWMISTHGRMGGINVSTYNGDPAYLQFNPFFPDKDSSYYIPHDYSYSYIGNTWQTIGDDFKLSRNSVYRIEIRSRVSSGGNAHLRIGFNLSPQAIDGKNWIYIIGNGSTSYVTKVMYFTMPNTYNDCKFYTLVDSGSFYIDYIKITCTNQGESNYTTLPTSYGNILGDALILPVPTSSLNYKFSIPCYGTGNVRARFLNGTDVVYETDNKYISSSDTFEFTITVDSYTQSTIGNYLQMKSDSSSMVVGRVLIMPYDSTLGGYISDCASFVPYLAMDLLNGTTYQNAAVIRGKVIASEGEFHGDIYAENGNFRGVVRATGGIIGGFTIEQDRLFNSECTAGIDILYGYRRVRIGKNATGSMNNEDAIMRVEVNNDASYNTGIYIDAHGGTNNYAFYGIGNGVLNGYMQGFKVKAHYVSNSSTITNRTENGATLKLSDGMVQALAYVDRNITNPTLYLPTLGEIKKTLGISGTVDFCAELILINQSEISGQDDSKSVKISGDTSRSYSSTVYYDSAFPTIMRGGSETYVMLDERFNLHFFITYINGRFIANYLYG